MRGNSLLVAALLAAGTTCVSGGESANPTLTTVSRSPQTAGLTLLPGPTTTAAPPPGAAVLVLTGVRLRNSEDFDAGLRLLVDSPAPEVSVTLTGIPSPNVVIVVCPAAELEVRAPAPGCVTPAPGETVHLPHGPSYKGIEVLQLGIVGTGPDPNAATVGQLVLTYAVASRNVRLRLPTLAPDDGQNRPSIRLAPAGAGTYRVGLRWQGAGTAEAVLTAGPSVDTRAEGGPGLELTGNVSPPAEATLAVRNTGSTPITGLTIEALFP